MAVDQTEFLAWLNRVADEAFEWEGRFPSYDRDPEGGHEMSAWAANIGSALYKVEAALTGESDESPYVYLCKCQPIGSERLTHG